MEARFDSDIGGDVPDWDNTESRESDEDAAWRDLIARFDEPTTPTEPVPWPARENVPGGFGPGGAQGADGTPTAEGRRGADGRDPGPRGAGDARGAAETRRTGETHGTGESRGAGDARAAGDVRGTDEAARAWGPDAADGVRGADGGRELDGVRGTDDEGVRGALDADGAPGAYEPDVIQAARRERRTAARGTRARKVRARKIRARKAPPRPEPADDEEHYIPPAPPPLPKLDPLAKGAWAALFGGPGYLIVATMADWPVPGIAAFCAVAAFVTGFVILVLRMNDPGPGGPDDGDDGAVV